MEHIKRLSEVFCANYNKLTGANYIFDGREDTPCETDFYIRDGSSRLSIQLSSIESAPRFFETSSLIDKVTEEILSWADRYRLNCSVYIKYVEIPLGDSAISLFVKQLTMFLNNHIERNNFKLRFDRQYDAPIFKGIFRYLSEFKIQSLNTTGFLLCTACEKWGSIRTIDAVVDYYRNNIARKDKKYYPGNDLIILFEMNPLPVTGISLEELRRVCKKIKFNCREIWQISLGDQGICDKIYPFVFKDEDNVD